MSSWIFVGDCWVSFPWTMRRGNLHVEENFEETHCNVLHHITLQAESTFTFQPNSYLKTPGVHSQKNYFHGWWFLCFHGIRSFAMPSWFMVPFVSWLSCTLYQQMLLSNLRSFEIYRWLHSLGITRELFFRRFWPLVCMHARQTSSKYDGMSRKNDKKRCMWGQVRLASMHYACRTNWGEWSASACHPLSLPLCFQQSKLASLAAMPHLL